jgi:hypothetical protein
MDMNMFMTHAYEKKSKTGGLFENINFGSNSKQNRLSSRSFAANEINKSALRATMSNPDALADKTYQIPRHTIKSRIIDFQTFIKIW